MSKNYIICCKSDLFSFIRVRKVHLDNQWQNRKPIFIFCIHEGRKNIHQTITIYIHIFGATYNAKYTHCKIIQVMVNLKTDLITTSFTED